MINHDHLQDPFDFMIDHFLQPTKQWHESFNEADLFQNLNEQYEETFMYELTPIQQCDLFHNIPVDLHFSATEMNIQPYVFDKSHLKQEVEDHQNAKIIFNAKDLKVTIKIGGEKDEPTIDNRIDIHLSQANNQKSLSLNKPILESENLGIQQINKKFCYSFQLQTSIRILKNERLQNMINIQRKDVVLKTIIRELQEIELFGKLKLIQIPCAPLFDQPQRIIIQRQQMYVRKQIRLHRGI
ncbi:UNKNOWN [Stylonychia lemnae]|uniref:Uncharacterized protein n=1 Tax=Stylonychia lemnae TaxID=5949 RepID=A0A078B434_STYLE|nr:UNKNOWN [Stylonychia lemnae]|eukprot:CDW89295.1 UNKNOWN [Stylonychia lemnae]